MRWDAFLDRVRERGEYAAPSSNSRRATTCSSVAPNTSDDAPRMPPRRWIAGLAWWRVRR
ncbi:hypothetical protein [Embleya sp. MST-111070]|uniref:hypothetical protein n=1 Tax=Embleya sp. MST-111070 TaxID=3398231 RepID=UPI003F73EE88